MRVVAGRFRGRPLDSPPGRDTRPTSDRVREAVFNALGSLDAIAGATVLDLFAGTGALGIEALSRGAARCTFVETDRAALRALKANLARFGLGPPEATVMVGDALRHAASAGTADLALLDPPYAFERWPELLALPLAELVVIESGRAVAVPPSWEIVREKRYGGTVVQLIQLVRPPAGTTGTASETHR